MIYHILETFMVEPTSPEEGIITVIYKGHKLDELAHQISQMLDPNGHARAF